jgi:hypothetical protein
MTTALVGEAILGKEFRSQKPEEKTGVLSWRSEV